MAQAEKQDEELEKTRQFKTPQNSGSHRDAEYQSMPSPTPANIQHRLEAPLETQARVDQDGERDLEQLAPVATGPVYSAFSNWKKRYIVLMVTLAAFTSPTSASIYFPALNSLQAHLGVSTELISLTITSYMIFQGLAPTVFGDLADMAGRRPAYILAFIIYMGANVGLALQDSYAALFILRCVQSTGSSGAIALGYGVVADISTSADRGKYMGIVGAGTMVGPALAPVIGGLLSQFLGWRAIFWFLVIIGGCFLFPYALTVPETGRNVVGNGSVPPQGWNMTVLEWYRLRKEEQSSDGLSRSATAEGRHRQQDELARARKLRFPNPLKTIHIIMEKDMALILIYNSLLYTAFLDIVASTPQLFQEIYHFNDLQIGLCYLPYGCACAVSSFTSGVMLDRNYKRVAKQIGFTIDRKHGDDLAHFPIERARMELIWPLLGLGLSAYLCYGWVLEKNVHLAVPLILQVIIGLTINGSFNVLSTLVVDLYPQSPSTATAANNLVRCLMGAAGTGIVSIMIKHMGRGWCFTLIALVCIAAMPLLWVELKWGPVWREERRVRLDIIAREKQRAESQEVDESSPNDETEAPTSEKES
ncbi:MFS general substrate transporter [Venustampulla echinocandica]|uniref:MFS general substrate transporter n=1 Tax=Venustampulla echinocandica TaxID=2656787 RepID=A0A370TDA7_9HELO|nr:MFS general substrate transporter [Venustampulla echinocandica]RDL32411.1 MFS general substrate transporter [Venustampulla echinocandica]